MPGTKSTNVEIEIFVNQIAHIIIKGTVRRSEILQYIHRMDNKPIEDQQKEGWYPICKEERTIDEYIRRAKDILKEINEKTLEDYMTLYACQLEYLYQRAIKKGHIQTANNIMKTKIWLRGLDGFQIKGNFDIKNFDISFTDEEQKAYQSRINEFYGNGSIKQIENKDNKNDKK